MPIVNGYTTRPVDLKPGDVMCYVVKAMVFPGLDGKLVYRLYRCAWEGDEAPEGERIFNNEQEVADALFPILGWAEAEIMK